MPDIRDRVEDDRGLLKKIQLVIPGFRGYRQREDLRDSDRMLRAELAKRLSIQRGQIEEFRRLLVHTDPMSDSVEQVGAVISQFKTLEGKVSHAETGYSGIAADIRIKQNEIDRLYDYDYSMVENLGFIDQGISDLNQALTGGNKVLMAESISNMRMRLIGFEEKFGKRKEMITGTGL